MKTMKLTIYQVDSFSEKPFKGNPAGVCVTDEILDVELMQNIAMEMNLSETAFVVPQAKTSVAGDLDGQRLYDLRWFTPKCEVDLCGHGTLAAAHILFTEYGITGELNFKTRSGILSAVQSSDGIVLDFPATDVEESHLPEDLKPLFSEGVLYTGKTEDLLFVELPTEMDIRNFKPDFSILKEAGIAELIITAWAGTKEETGGY
ncbi:MAG: PhzF family phenazine biosynthesis protein, partial [Spirochaetales bacterium]|nr:PhzF family phenazine biosynthesis protein [Spirochaetales bacterium]